MTIASRVGTLITTAILAFGIAMPAKADLIKELIPTGKLRVAIAIAPAPSALYAVRDSTPPASSGASPLTWALRWRESWACQSNSSRTWRPVRSRIRPQAENGM